jgi:peptidoglycan-N-acetylglucosamine deacetylase
MASMVALTFDDGPDPVWTPRVLNALERAGATATFFVHGRSVLKHPALTYELLERGHRIEPHCHEHVSHKAMSRREISLDLRCVLAAMASIRLPTPMLWRPPYGETRTWWTRTIAATHGLTTVLWTVDTQDWTGKSASAMLRAAEPALEPDSVILMHDTIDRDFPRCGCEETVALIEPLVAAIRARDLDVGPLSRHRLGAARPPGMLRNLARSTRRAIDEAQ